ncbi:phosphate system positive regulatory protein pho81, partial [Ascosphaera aggregata]
LIKQLSVPRQPAQCQEQLQGLSITANLPGTKSSVPGCFDHQSCFRESKDVFFFRLEREIEKVNVFYLQKEAEFSLRLKTLLDKKRVVQSRRAATVHAKTPAAYVSLFEGFQQFDADLHKLQRFVEINETAVSKILKKWDKATKSHTKEMYLQRAVEVQPCFNREVLRDLSDRATTAKLELEAWAEGENIQFDATSRTAVAPHIVEEDDTELHMLQAMGPATEDGMHQLREWVERVRATTEASERVTRMFLAAISSPDTAEEALCILLGSGLIDIHAEDDINERNCLHEAVIAGCMFVFRAALERGVDCARSDVYGRLPLHYACIHGRTEMVRSLLDADPTTTNVFDHASFTPLIHAIVRDQTSCVEVLLSRNARVEPEAPSMEEDGENAHVPLNLACKHASLPIIQLLLKSKAKIRPDAEGLYPQHIVAKSGRSAEVLLALRDSGADLNERDKIYNWTPLFHAASEGHAHCLRTLLDNWVEVDALDEKGLNAMYYAAWEGHLECMIMLWEQRRRRESIVASATTPAIGYEAVSKTAEDHLTGKSPSPPAVPSSVIAEMPEDEMQFESLPDLSLPPPIIPMRRYGHNFLESKAFVQLYFDPLSEVDSVAHPPAVPSVPATSSSSPAGSRAPATGPITFYQPGRYAAARLTLSSKNSDLIPRTIMLPMHNSSDSAADQERIVTFQVDLERPDPFALELEVFPTFGSKPIAKTIALPEVFVGPSTVSGEERHIGKSGTCILPLLDPRLRAIGEVRFKYMVIQPYHGEPLEITHFATYWKATTTGTEAEPHARHPSNLRGIAPSTGLLSSSAAAATMPPTATAGLVTGSSLSSDYVQLFVQLTRDLVPVVYPHFTVKYYGLDIPVSHLTYEQFRDTVPAGLHQSEILSSEERMHIPPSQVEDRLSRLSALSELDLPQAHRVLAYSFVSLREVLSHLSSSINVNLCILYSAPSMSATCTTPSDTQGNKQSGGILLNQLPTDINTHVDAILTDVFNHARAAKENSPEFMRSMMFTSFCPDICIALNWKQPNYPVFLCNDMGKFKDLTSTSGSRPVIECSGRTSMSVKESARVAQSNNLMGVILRSSLLNLMPALTDSIRELGLAIIADTSDEAPPPAPPAAVPLSIMGMLKRGTATTSTAGQTSPGLNDSAFRMPEGVNGVMRGTGVLRFNDSVDM